MPVYLDSSALVKRAVQEAESDVLEAELERRVADGTALVSSSLAWIEVTRALRTRSQSQSQSPQLHRVHEAAENALSGIGERPIGADVVALARRLGPAVLRTLDAIHLASAIVLDCELVIAYDARLIDACRVTGIGVASPGR